MEWDRDLPKDWRLLDTSAVILDGEALLPFVVEELECREIGKGAQPLIHIWRHRKACILGLRDRRLPRAREAMDWLEQQGYAVAVRNSGGAAVPLDEGVLNLSLILPNHSGTVKLHEDFTMMAGLISSTSASSSSLTSGPTGGVPVAVATLVKSAVTLLKVQV